MTGAYAIHIAAAIAAGAVLNFMPCVLPVMPFKIQALLRETSGTARSRAAAAVALMAGSLTFFILLGAVTAALGLMWGQQFQLPWFRMLLALVLFFAAVATFTGWSWRLPQFVYRVPMGRHLGAFLTGALAGILSTPCSGPFLGSVLAFAATRAPFEILVIFSAIGFGLAFPYAVLMVWPAFLKRLSFNSRIAVHFKTVLGFALLAGSLFFSQGFLPFVLMKVAWVGLLAGVGIWAVLLFTGGSRKKLRPVLIVALAMLAVTGFRSFSSHAVGAGIAWQPYSDQRLAAASGRAVLVEFTADWCINCKSLEQTTFRKKELLETIDALGVVPLQVDLTQVDDNRRAILTRFGGYAIPYIVLFDKKGQIVKQYTGMVGADTLVENLKAIGG